MAETQANEILVARAGGKYQAGGNADAVSDGFIEKLLGIDLFRQFDPQHGAANGFRGPRSGREVLRNEGAGAFRILLQHGPQGLQVAVVVAAGEKFGQGQLLQQAGGAGIRAFEA